MSQLGDASFNVATTLAAYRAVANLTGTAQAVKYPASSAEMPIGITVNDVINTSDDIAVKLSGIAKLMFADSCVSGSFVAIDSAGKGVPHTNVTAGSYVIGTLVGPKVETAGAIGDVLIQPKFKSIP